MNKTLKKLMKYTCNKAAIIVTVLLLIVIAIGYVFVQYNCLKLEQTPIPEDPVAAASRYEEQTNLGLYKEFLVVAFSVIGGAWLSTLFIEKKKNNDIAKEVLVDDILTSDQFWASIEEKRRNEILDKLEGLALFDGDYTKAKMYNSIRRKINAFGAGKQTLFYDECSMEVSCYVTDRYIEKRVVKMIKVRSYDLSKPTSDFLLLSVAGSDRGDECPATITRVSVDNRPLNIERDIRKKVYKKVNDRKSDTRGYSHRVDYTIKKVMDFSNKTAKIIEVEYTTRCPLDDLTYNCKMPFACQKFEFRYSVHTDGYVLNPIAFGFVDDGNGAPTRVADRTSVTFRFDDWVFPLDGVCVYLEKTVTE